MDQPKATRRQAVTAMTGLALAGGLEPASAQPAAQPAAETARGVVREAAGAGLAGVMVSNGRDVVLTDADGQWRLGVRPGDAIFVIKPSDYAVPVDPVTHLPRFSHLHAPDGTPAALDFRFPGLAPTGPLPAEIVFTLRHAPEPRRFNALVFTDPQPESLAEVGFVRDDVVAQTAGIDAAFGITTGDVMFDDLSFYDRYNRIIGALGLPWWNCCGNHDMNFEAPDNTLSRETFKRVFGARHAAFQYGGATFLLLDNVDYAGFNATKPLGNGGYRGFFGAAQLGFVRAVLARVPQDALVVCCFHIPLRTAVGDDPASIAVDAREFLAAMSSHPNGLSLCGHTHTNEHFWFGAGDGFAGGAHHHHVMSAVSGSWWSGPFDERGIPVALQIDGAPNGFHVLSVADGRATMRLVPARDPERGRLRIMLDAAMHRGHEVDRDVPMGALLRGPISRAAVASTRVLVNLYDGGPRSTVTLSVDGGAPITLARAIRTDPFVEEVYARNAATKKPWVKAAPSSHVWQGHLPDIAEGTHRLAVSAVDEWGEAHQAMMVLEVV